MTDRATLDVGSTLGGRYELIEEIGKGGFGTIYRARQVNVDRDVALKVLPPRFAAMQNIVHRFQREARLASRLRHPNTITIHDYGRQENYFYIAMEYLRGEDLAERLRRDKTLPLSQLLHIGTQSLRSLQEAHDLGIIHRDLKPENIFLTHMGDDTNFVKVLDFGIAKLADSESMTDGEERKLTVQGSTVGTPTYMSPEQAAGEAIEAQSDLYSLGVILYEMANGHPPFDDERPVRVMRAHLFDPVPAFSNGELRNTGLESVIRKAMEKDPSHRFGNAAEFIEALSEPNLLEKSLGFFQVGSPRNIAEDESSQESDSMDKHDEVPFDAIPSPAAPTEEAPPSGFSAKSGSITSSIITVLEEPTGMDVIVLTERKEENDLTEQEVAEVPPATPGVDMGDPIQESRSQKKRTRSEWGWDDEITTTDTSGSQLLTDLRPVDRRRRTAGLLVALVITVLLFVVLVATGWIPLIF